VKLPEVRQSPPKIESRIENIGFKGLNRMPIVNQGELTAMTNLSSRYSPCLYPRDPRQVINTLTSGQALFAANSKLCWVDGINFVYNGVVKGTVSAGRKSIAEYFGIILVMPDKKYYNYSTDVFGDIPNCPDMDYICVHNNRAFGVKGNNLYGSKLGDPLTWNQFSVPLSEADSYQTNSGEEGDFTGIIAIQNHIICTKENYIYELYGNKPSNFKLQLIAKSGCNDYKSMTEIDGALLFMSKEGIKIYTGSIPKLISLNLNETYVSGTAGSDGRKYYISLYNGSAYNLYVYDTYNGLWHREDNLNIKDFAWLDGYLYALSENSVYRFNSGSEIVSFEAETERFTERHLGAKVTSKIKVMAELGANAMLRIYYKIDEGDYAIADTIITTGYYYYTTYVKPERANSFQIKFEGSGDVKIYELTREMTLGSDITKVASYVLTFDSLEDKTWDTLENLTFSEINKAEV